MSSHDEFVKRFIDDQEQERLRATRGGHLSGFGVSNFKAFDSLQEVPLRRITMLFGRNNSGKSALLRSLVHGDNLFHIDGPVKDNLRYTDEGSRADVGKYPEYLHDDATDRESVVTYTVPLSSLSEVPPCFAATQHVTVAYHYCFRHLTQEDYEIHDTDGTHILQGHLSVIVDDDQLLSKGKWKTSSGAWKKLLVNSWQLTFGREPLPEEISRLVAISQLVFSAEFTTDYYESLPESVGIEPRLQQKRRRKDVAEDFGLDVEPSIVECFLRDQGLQGDISNIVNSYEEVILRMAEGIDTITTVVHAIARYTLAGSVYLGPLRTIPGSTATKLEHKASGADLWRELTESPDVLAQTNRWLARLQTDPFPSQLAVRVSGENLVLDKTATRLIEKELLSCAEQLLQEARNHATINPSREHRALAAMNARTLARAWAEHIASLPGMFNDIEICVRSTGANHLLPPSHVGLGLSQVIPILVAAATHASRLVLVEQPELHLHPAMQAELADVFIESSQGTTPKTWVIETHSEHIILRLMRRIRETKRGTLKEGVSPLRPEDVSICFVERESGVSRVYPIELDENGMLTRPWPGGFFEEGFREVMAW